MYATERLCLMTQYTREYGRAEQHCSVCHWQQDAASCSVMRAVYGLYNSDNGRTLLLQLVLDSGTCRRQVITLVASLA